MKRVFGFILLISLGASTMQGCRSSRDNTGILGGAGGTIAKTVATVVGAILLSKIIKSVLGTITGSGKFSNFASDQNFINNFNEETRLNSFVQNDVLKTALQLLVAQRFEIPMTTVANNFNSLVTVGDLATFIGKNASPRVLNEIKQQ